MTIIYSLYIFNSINISTIMKTLKILFLMFMVTGFLVSCGGETTATEETTTEETTEEAATEEAATEEAATEEAATEE